MTDSSCIAIGQGACEYNILYAYAYNMTLPLKKIILAKKETLPALLSGLGIQRSEMMLLAMASMFHACCARIYYDGGINQSTIGTVSCLLDVLKGLARSYVRK